MSRIEAKYFSLGTEITAEQFSFFDEHGYIIFKNFISKEMTELYKNEMDRVGNQWIADGHEKINGIPLKFGKDEDGNKIVQRFCFLSQYSDAFKKLMQSSQLGILLKFLEPYEGRIGENEKDGLVLNNYLRTPESSFSQMGWHTDSPRDLFMGQRIMPMLNIGIHLDDCPFENGGLRVIPGTHKQNFFKLMFGKKYFIDNTADKKEVGFNIDAGDLSIHDGRIWHRVEPSPYTGKKSQRRVMYVPAVTGAYKPKDVNSKTPFYHRLGKTVSR
jgi:phytanoyl-CoA hydroxylase